MSITEGTPPATPPAPPATPPVTPPPGDPPVTPPTPPVPPVTPPAPPVTPPVTPPATPPAAPPVEPPPAETKWRDGIADPALKNIAERIASPTDAVKIIQDLRTQNSKMIKPPDANATPEEKAKWLKAIGVPETPTGDTGYKITPPDGITLTDADTGLIDAILPVAHENQVPAAALNGFIGELLKKSRAMEAETVKAITDYGNAQEAALKKEWGNDYEANCNLAKRVVDVVGGDGLKAVFNTVKVEGGGLLGDHPDLMRFLANLGRRMDEGDLMIGSTKEERATVQQEIEALNKAVPIGSAGYSDKAHQAKLQSLYDKLYGNQVIVGGQNRAA